jgi:hypothetical protein
MNTAILASEHVMFQFVAGFAVCALACGLVMAGRISIRRAADSEQWPTVDGFVTESTVVAFNDGRRQRFRPVVRYRYTVAGRCHDGDRVAWDGMAGFRKYTAARRVLDRYRAGNSIAVHHDPRRPDVAVLQPGQPIGMPPMRVIAPIAASYVMFC